MFDALGQGVDVISDFGAGDVLAIGNLLSGFAPGQQADFVRLLNNGPNTTVQLDVDGAANGSAYQDLVVLTGVTGTTADHSGECRAGRPPDRLAWSTGAIAAPADTSQGPRPTGWPEAAPGTQISIRAYGRPLGLLTDREQLYTGMPFSVAAA